MKTSLSLLGIICLVFLGLAVSPSYAQAGVAISIGGLLNFLIYAIIICVVLWLIWWLIGYINPPEPFNKFLRIAVVVVGVLILIIMLLNLAGAVNFR
jgi:hypothetical protein